MVKEWLERGRLLDVQINALIEERDRLFELATQSTLKTGEVRVQFSHQNCAEMSMVRYTHYSLQIDKLIDELVAVKREILITVAQVSDARFRTLLELRYISFYSWEKIAEEMSYTPRQIHRLHKKALDKVENIIECKA